MATLRDIITAILARRLANPGTALGAAMAAETNTWIAPTLLNSWVNYNNGVVGDAGYYKDVLGRVYVRGVIKDGTATASTVLFQLPAGYRPSREVVCNVRGSNTTETVEGAARVDVKTNGDVIIVSGDVSGFGTGGYLSLDGISFLAEQ